MSYGCRWNYKQFSVACPQVSDDKWRRIFGHDKAKVDIEQNAPTPKSMCQRDDFEFTKKLDKNYKDFLKFTNKNDRNKIENEITGRQQEYRNGVIEKELKTKYGY
jgi:hypothetical protein